MVFLTGLPSSAEARDAKVAMSRESRVREIMTHSDRGDLSVVCSADTLAGRGANHESLPAETSSCFKISDSFGRFRRWDTSGGVPCSVPAVHRQIDLSPAAGPI